MSADSRISRLHRLLAMMMCAMSMTGNAMAKDFHVDDPTFFSIHMDIILPPPVRVIDDIWIFSSFADHTIMDSTRPPMVLDLDHGLISAVPSVSGPWIATLTDTDPFGTVHPHLGIRLTLAPGGTPIAGEGVVVFHPTVAIPIPPGVTEYISDFWNVRGAGIESASGVPRNVEPNIPATLTNPADAYRYAWSAAVVPEPETYALMAVGIALIGFSQRNRTKQSSHH